MIASHFFFYVCARARAYVCALCVFVCVCVFVCALPACVCAFECVCVELAACTVQIVDALSSKLTKSPSVHSRSFSKYGYRGFCIDLRNISFIICVSVVKIS